MLRRWPRPQFVSSTDCAQPANLLAKLRRRSLAEVGAEHGTTALRLRTRSLVFDYVPVLDQQAVGDAHNVCCNPVLRLTVARETSVDDHELPFSDNQPGLVFQRWRGAFY